MSESALTILKCMYCGHEGLDVKDSRPSVAAGAVRRRRQCSQCRERITTFEVHERMFPAKEQVQTALIAKMLALPPEKVGAIEGIIDAFLIQELASNAPRVRDVLVIDQEASTHAPNRVTTIRALLAGKVEGQK